MTALTVDDRPLFESTLLRTTALGALVAAAAAAVSNLCGRGPFAPPEVVLALVACVLVLAPGALVASARLALLAGAGVTAALVPVSLAPWVFVVALGLALAAGRPSRRAKLLAFAATGAGALWFLAVEGSFGTRRGALVAAAHLAALLAPGLFVGLALGAAHLVGRGESLRLRLQRLGDARPELTGGLELLGRLQTALAWFPPSAEKAQVLRVGVDLGEQVLARAGEVATLDATLQTLGLRKVRAAHAALLRRAESARDAAVREQLAQAASLQSDNLEQAASLERRRDRAEAALSLSLSRLEKAALAVELTPVSREALAETAARLAVSVGE